MRAKIDVSRIQTVNKMYTQVSIGKDSIDKINIEYHLSDDMYNDTCVSFPKRTNLSDNRKRQLKKEIIVYPAAKALHCNTDVTECNAV